MVAAKGTFTPAGCGTDIDCIATRASFGPPVVPMEDRPGGLLAGPVRAGRVLVVPAV